MKRLCIFLLFLSACGKTSNNNQSETKNIFGEDNREAITTNRYPWNTIGRVLGSRCTGTLVYKDLVLTAAHCVIDPATKKLRTDLTYFEANVVDNRSLDRGYISHVWWGTNDPDKERGSDWAILKLNEKVGSRVGWLGTVSTTVNSFPDELSVAGYSGDFRQGVTAGVHHNCKTRNRYANWILHDCDTSRGSSGGPALRMKDGNLTVYGLNVAEYRDGGETSLKVEKYEDRYGNIVIPSKDAVTKLKELIAADQ